MTGWTARAAGALLAVAACWTSPVLADEIRDYNVADPVPAAVAAQVTCDRVGDSGRRQAFAGGFLFLVSCPSNHANQVQALVLARDGGGQGARGLTFPGPGGKSAEPADSLANPRIFPKRREITQASVDPETRICRTEGRWRLEGAEARPRLVFWRQTRDCAGKRGWRVLVDRRGH